MPWPGVPPIGESKFSRAVFFDLDETTRRLQDEAEAKEGARWSAWQPHAMRVLLNRQGFEDAFFVESVHVADSPCPATIGPRGAHVPGENARSYLTMGQVADVDPNCLVGDDVHTRPYVQTNGRCGPTIVPGEQRTPSGFLPRCLVVLLAVESRRALFDQMMADGRVLAEPLCDTISDQTPDT
mgnify:CR=1 FL=1